jgi:hypothetical protein
MEIAMTREKELREWIVVDGNQVVYRGTSCGAAVALIDKQRLKPTCLFVSSNVVNLLREPFPKSM